MTLVRRLAVLAALLAAASAWSGSALAADVIPHPGAATPQVSDYRARIGETLTVTTGTWYDVDSPPGVNLPITYTYQWQRCGLDIAGATGSSYTTSSADAECGIRAQVTATNGLGFATLPSNSTQAIFPHTVDEEHVVVHYQSYGVSPGSITAVQASDFAVTAESAYRAETAAGFTIPGDGGLGGDSRIDYYIVPLFGYLGLTIPDQPSAPTSTSYIEINGTAPTAFLSQTVAHELFHVVQLAIWNPPSLSDYWVLEGSAEWMGYKAAGYAYDPGFDHFVLGDWSMSLDCRNSGFETQCDPLDDYVGNGYSRWPFFEYAYERYGADFLTSIFQQSASGGGSAIDGISGALGGKNSSLTDFFTDWAVANLTGDYTVEKLQIQAPTYGKIVAGTLTSLNRLTKPGQAKVVSGPIPSLTVPLNHLSARYVEIDRGDVTAPDAPCYAATLALKVTVPSGTGARPYYWWSQRNADGTKLERAQALTIADGVGSITVPWDTCNWDGTNGYLALSNPSTTLDGQAFTITGTLSVDRTTQASPKPPPDPVRQHGPTVDTSTVTSSGSGDVPQVSVFGPQVLRIAAGAKQLRVVVSSNGPGQLQAALGSLKLGTKALRAGGNDLRFSLPKTVTRTAKSTRAAKSEASVLTLTPLSTGGAAGKPVTRRVVLLAPTGKVAAGIRR